MNLYLIHAGHFACDGGALFGAIPKALWQRSYSCNENNMIKLTMRCLLIEYADKKILIEAGVGDHYGEKLRRNNGHEDVDALEKSLNANGFNTSDITDVVFTHLHWDHCNGAVIDKEGKFELLFPNANYWCSRKQWEHSFKSNRREQAAYYREILDFLKQEGNMKLIDSDCELFKDISIRMYDGHTPGQIIPFININNKTYVYTADFIPTSAHVPIIWLAAYDLFPVVSMEEKEKFLKEAADKEYVLLFEHDYYNECVTVKWDDIKGSSVKEKFNLDRMLCK